MNKPYTWLATLLILFTMSTLQAQSPNFIIILADDQGWTGTSVQMDASDATTKSDYYYTPNLEQLATDGMTFSQAYAAAPKCSPSRNAILTGKSPARTQFTTTSTGGVSTSDKLIEGFSNTSIDSDNETVAEWLKAAGLNYRTAHYGKWHLGNGGPSSHGFDYGSGNTDNDDGNAVDGLVNQTDPKKMFELTSDAITFMNDAVTANEPFYLQISHYAVHTAIEATQDRLDWYDVLHQRPVGTTHTDNEYAAMTEDLDSAVGLILAEVAALGITGDTYIIYTSDNGAATGKSSNSPLSRGKTFIYEGGIRVPFFIKGPNITANSRSDEPIIGYDLLPTIAELSQGPNALPTDVDGEDISGIWDGGGFTRVNPLYFHSPHYETNASKTPRSAIRSGDYKLIVEYETGNEYLFNLSSDKGEGTDIASSNSTTVETMRKALRDHLKDVSAVMPALDETHVDFSGTGTDVDADGLEDAWELINSLNHTYGPTDNIDGDIATFQEEHDYDSDPLTDEGLTNTAAKFNSSAVTMLESAGNTTVSIAFPVTNNTGSPITVGYTIGGTATAGVDYVALTGTADIANGTGKIDITIAITDDLDDESDETIILTLDLATSDGSVTLGTITTYTVTISDNECAQNALDLTLKTCTVDHTTDALTDTYSETISSDVRIITTNAVPNHNYRAPSAIAEQPSTLYIDYTPTQAGSVTNLLGETSGVAYQFGFALNGVEIAPIAAEPFENTSTGESNWDWVQDFSSSPGDLSADCNYAHLQNGGQYHYHGDMVEYANVLLAGLGDGTTIPTAPVQIGWAADGFPLYYKYGYNTPMDNTSGIKEYGSNYALKSGSRDGDGVSAPCGTYNGFYMQDYEYNAGNGGDLDECNGITGVTDEFPSGTYYYVVTSTYPMIPRCLMGTPSSSFGGNGVVLPVELTSFDGTVQDNHILLEWRTETEHNNKGFEVRKSLNGLDWETLDFVEGEGSSFIPINYNYVDNEMQYGEVYYQLNQVDFDGKSEMSETIILYIKKPNSSFRLYPNPTTGHLNFELNDIYAVQNISIFNTVGQLVKQPRFDNNAIGINDLPKGIYFIMVELSNGEILKEKIVKQ